MRAHLSVRTLVACLVAAYPALCDAGPAIEKLGTVAVDLVEAAPIVYQGRLYRFEYVRARYKENSLGQDHFRFLDAVTGEASPPFGEGYALGSAYAEGDVMRVYGVPAWGADTITVFTSRDLAKWEERAALRLPGWGIYNNSVCRGPDGYTMAFEVGEPADVVGHRFTVFFAHSSNLLDWTPAPLEMAYSREKYTACPAIRFYGGWYYLVYLEQLDGWRFATCVARSRDLAKWEESPLNPLLAPGPEDKRIANPGLTGDDRAHIAAAENINNSDVDFCTHEGTTRISYSWGNQRGTEFLAEARFAGTERELLESMFPGTE